MKSPVLAFPSFLLRTIHKKVFGKVLMHAALHCTPKRTFCHLPIELEYFAELSYITSLHSFPLLLILPSAPPNTAAVNQ